MHTFIFLKIERLASPDGFGTNAMTENALSYMLIHYVWSFWPRKSDILVSAYCYPTQRSVQVKNRISKTQNLFNG